MITKLLITIFYTIMLIIIPPIIIVAVIDYSNVTPQSNLGPESWQQLLVLVAYQSTAQ